MTYTGEQLKPHFAYFNHNLQGDSAVAWIGPCQIPLEHMIDGEDFLANETIAGQQMLHFIIELFHQNIFTAVSFQRLISAIVKDCLCEKLNPQMAAQIYRRGDDIYYNNSKFSISIASSSRFSSMIHFAVNISNEGTPVQTCALNDFSIEAKSFADEVLKKITIEWQGVVQATTKVKAL